MLNACVNVCGVRASMCLCVYECVCALSFDLRVCCVRYSQNIWCLHFSRYNKQHSSLWVNSRRGRRWTFKNTYSGDNKFRLTNWQIEIIIQQAEVNRVLVLSIVCAIKTWKMGAELVKIDWNLSINCDFVCVHWFGSMSTTNNNLKICSLSYSNKVYHRSKMPNKKSWFSSELNFYRCFTFFCQNFRFFFVRSQNSYEFSFISPFR